MKTTHLALGIALIGCLFSVPGRASDDYDLLVQDARSESANGEFSRAASDLEKALARRESYALRVELAQDYVLAGRWSDAKAEYALAKRLDPKAGAAYIDEGYFSAAVGESAAAEKDWKDLIAAQPQSYAGYRHLGTYLRRAGRSKEGESYLKKALSTFDLRTPAREWGPVGTLLDLAGTLDWRSHPDEAQSLFKEGLIVSRDFPTGRCMFLTFMGDFQMMKGRRPEAEKSYREALAACRGDKKTCWRLGPSGALRGLAWLYIEEDRLEQAEAAADASLKYFEPYWPIDPQSFELDMRALDGIADAYRAMGKDVKAEAVYRRVRLFLPALGSSESLVIAEMGLADICARSGRKQEAEDLLRDASRRRRAAAQSRLGIR